MKNPPLHLGLVLAATCAFLPAAHAGSIIVSRLASGKINTLDYNLDTYGSTDWVLYSTAGNVDISKSSGTGISDLTTNFTRTSTPSGYDPSFSWTGGTPTASASISEQNFAASPGNTGTGDVASLTATATTSLQTLYIFAGAGLATARLDVSLGDTSASAVSDTYSVGTDYGHIVYKIDYFADTDTLLNVSWTKTAHNGPGSSSIRFQGAALTVPEPSSALLSATALGLLALRRRR